MYLYNLTLQRASGINVRTAARKVAGILKELVIKRFKIYIR